LNVDINPAKSLDLLPHAEPQGGFRNEVVNELNKELESIKACLKAGWPTLECEETRSNIFTNGFYNNGKGLQRLATVCLLSHRLFGSDDDRTTKCSELLENAFACHYRDNCAGVPHAYYDQAWGGIASRQGYTTRDCGLADFGNACYNDHHYHYGYFIHAGAIMLYLRPDMKADNSFVKYINSMIRDVANPSKDDPFFPQFRAFDWYDLHSWSHGVTPSADGKDEESTSEDMNAYFGIQMWAKLNNFVSLEHTAQMMLSLLAHSAKNLFLLSDGNDVHPPEYIKNRVTGIFFESKVHYGTFFGSDSQFIHGIQMIPLTPALLLARDKQFCQQEWDDIISKIPLPLADTGANAGWSSLLITGSMAIVDPHRAFGMLRGLSPGGYDKGLSKAWAMYWAAALAAKQR